MVINLKIKKEATVELVDEIMYILSTAPDGQMSGAIKESVISFMKDEHSLEDKYNFVNDISKLELGEISEFIKVMCSLDEYYMRKF